MIEVSAEASSKVLQLSDELEVNILGPPEEMGTKVLGILIELEAMILVKLGAEVLVSRDLLSDEIVLDFIELGSLCASGFVSALELIVFSPGDKNC